MSHSYFLEQLDRVGPFAPISTLVELLHEAPECEEAETLRAYVEARGKNDSISSAMVAMQ